MWKQVMLAPFHGIGNAVAAVLSPCFRAYFSLFASGEHGISLAELKVQLSDMTLKLSERNSITLEHNQDVLNIAKGALDSSAKALSQYESLRNDVVALTGHAAKQVAVLETLTTDNRRLIAMEREANEIAQVLVKESIGFGVELHRKLEHLGCPVQGMNEDDLMLYVLDMMQVLPPNPDTLPNPVAEAVADIRADSESASELTQAIAKSRNTAFLIETETTSTDEDTVAALKPTPPAFRQAVVNPASFVQIAITESPTDPSTVIEHVESEEPE
jgi:hypothetical protein